MKQKVTKDISWGNSDEENKILVRATFAGLGGNKSLITVKTLEYSMEVTHQNHKDPIIITRKYFDDKDIEGIKSLLQPFLKS